MKIFKKLIVAFWLCGLTFCYGQEQSSQYNDTYKVGQIPDTNNFSKLNIDEIRMDSIIKENTITGFGAFKINRSRIFADEFINEKKQLKDTSLNHGLAVPCQCYTKSDTLYIKMEIGFFGGFAFKIKIYGENFESGYLEYTDDVKPYKSNLNDTAFYSYAQVNNKFQYLIIQDKPTFTIGQQIMGLLTFTTNNYYEKTPPNSLNTIFLSGKIYFTCKTREETSFDNLLWYR